MMALFVGVLALALGFVMVTNAGRELDARTFRIEGYNTVILAPAEQEKSILAELGPSPTAVLAQTGVRAVRGTGNESVYFLANELLGATEPYNYRLSGAPWDPAAEGVYVWDQSPISTGNDIEITSKDGKTHKLPVIGNFTIERNPTTMWEDYGPLMSLNTSRAIAPPDTVRVYAELEPGQFTSLLNTLQNATVIDLAAYAARLTQTYYNLYIIAAAFSGLALLAGFLLIANGVSLAMLERQYEIGVLKTIGYTRRDLLLTFAVEYGVIALIVSAAGLAVVQLLLTAFGIANRLAQLLVLSVSDVVTIFAIVLALMLLTVLVVTWQPIRRSPVFILND
jgi:hypothetical protein